MGIKFSTREDFREKEYSLLPFRFSKIDNEKYFLSTDYGEWDVIDTSTLNSLIFKKTLESRDVYYRLKAGHFITTDRTNKDIELLSSKYKTKKAFIENFSQLHIFVLTVRCNNSCVYCQASRKSCHADHRLYDMTDDVLEKSIDLFLSMPSDNLTLEFQGGESTLTMPLVRKAVTLVNEKNIGKNIQFVICTNLCDINDDDLYFLIHHNVAISTSLDGPEKLHNANRKFGNTGAYTSLNKTLEKIRDAGAFERVSALMTTTRESLGQHKEIIDEYINQGFRNIFIRELNPYGFAQKYFNKIGYDAERFIAFYEECIDYIIYLNKKGTAFRESYASLILKKLLTPWSTGFVDLQSPCGSGFGVTLYNYDGCIYPSDESRMMAETGDTFFRMGNILTNTREEIFFGPVMQKLAAAGVNDSLPVCSDCAFAPYCGADPVRRYQVTGSIYGHPGKDEFCMKNKSIIQLLINKLINSDQETREILMQWGLK